MPSSTFFGISIKANPKAYLLPITDWDAMVKTYDLNIGNINTLYGGSNTISGFTVTNTSTTITIAVGSGVAGGIFMQGASPVVYNAVAGGNGTFKLYISPLDKTVGTYTPTQTSGSVPTTGIYICDFTVTAGSVASTTDRRTFVPLVITHNHTGGNNGVLLTNAAIDPAAAIAYSKLTLTNSIMNADVNTSAAIAYSKLNLATSIVNADIAAGAAIVYSKLSLATSIVNADIAAGAAIVYSKLSLTGGIVNADINASAAIVYSKLSLTGGIVNADVNASAAIVYSKLSLTTSIVNGDINASAAIAYSKLNLATSIVNGDIAASAAIDLAKVAYTIQAKTTTYTIVTTDSLITGDATGAAFTITLPTAVGATGKRYTVKKIDSSGNAVTVGTTSSQTIDGVTTSALSTQWQKITVVSNGSNWLTI